MGGFGGGSAADFEDLFNSFFGDRKKKKGKGGKKKKKSPFGFDFDFGDAMGGGFDDFGGHDDFNGGFDEEPAVSTNLFQESDVIHLDLSAIFKFYKRQEIWTIYFYNPKDEKSKKFEDSYKEFANKMYGIIKVGAINCEEEIELCEEMSVYSTPALLAYTESFNDDGERYQGDMEINKISKFATNKMQNFVSLVTDDNYEKIMEREGSNMKILLFTERKSTSPLMKSLSKKYKGKLVFGEVRKSQESELAKKFKIKKFPTLIAVTDPQNYEFEAYDGEMKPDRLSLFLGKFAYEKQKKEKKAEWVQLN